MTWRQVLAIVAVSWATAALFWVSSALAHGEAHWIAANSEYRDAAGAHCCGVSDCQPAAPGEIERVPEGWLHVPTGTVLIDGIRGIYPSIEARTFRCVRGGTIKCVFPAMGI